jgi:hypothetical protein
MTLKGYLAACSDSFPQMTSEWDTVQLLDASLEKSPCTLKVAFLLITLIKWAGIRKQRKQHQPWMN